MVKSEPEQYRAVVSGLKTAEFRKNDRDYHVGDLMLLNEYDPQEHKRTGRDVVVKVSYVNYGPQFGGPEGYCVLSIRKVLVQ